MAMETVEPKRIINQRRIRRLRQQRLLHGNGNGTEHISLVMKPPKKELLISDLGWTAQETLDTYHRLRNFALVWDGPGMEEYDEM